MKKLLSCVLTTAMLLSMCSLMCVSPATVGAATSGDFTYEVNDDNTVTITAYNGSEEDVTVPSTIDGYVVTAIGEYAFYYCDVTLVALPDSLVHIGEYAFAYCFSLESPMLPDGLISIGSNAFYQCSSLKTVTIPDSVTSIGCDAFCYTALYQTASNRENGALYIDGCLICVDSETIGEFTVRESTRLIASEAFGGCREITSLVIPVGVTSIGKYAFYDCFNLESVYYSGTADNWVGITFEDAYANPAARANSLYFQDELVTDVVLSDGVSSISENAFYYYTALTSITIPDSVKEIGYDAFSGCNSLVDVYYGGTADAWVDITFYSVWWSSPFEYMENLYFEGELVTDVVLSDGVTAINAYAFCCYEKLGVIKLPSSITSIGEAAFSSCYNLELIYYEGSEMQWDEIAVGNDNESLEYARIIFDYYENGPVISSNIDRHYYTNARRYNDTITSTVAAENDGYMRVEHIDQNLLVEYYDASFQFLSRKEIPLELPLYGGVYIADDYNFVIVGQDNPNEDDSVEVFRVIRYSKDWERQASCGLFGANTYIPFDAGTLRCDQKGDVLYVRTAHEMYASERDGLHHQANVTFTVNIPDMTVINSQTGVMNNRFGYVSHSFNQFIRVDGDTLLAVDHGDAHPRSICLFRYNDAASDWMHHTFADMVNVLPIAESTYHYNDTGVSVGGFEASSTHYLVVGSTADQSAPSALFDDINQRNIFVTATPKNDFTDKGTTIRYLTNYAEGAGVDVSPPHLVKISDDRFLLMWMDNGVLTYCYLKADGTLDGAIHTGKGTLSDCAPIVDGNRIVWYVTDDSTPRFYQIGITADSSDGGVVVSKPTKPTTTSTTTTTTTTTTATSVTEATTSTTITETTVGESTTTSTLPAPDAVAGDTDGDGDVDIRDAVLCYYYVNGKTVLDEEQQMRADIAAPDGLNIKDAVTIYYFVNGKIETM